MIMNILRFLGVSGLLACVVLLVCAVAVDADAYESAMRYAPDDVSASAAHLDESVLAEQQQVAHQLGQAAGITALIGFLSSATVWFSERKRRRQSKSRRKYIRPRSRVHR